MEDNKTVTMFVQWKEQRRQIKIKITDDLNAVENAVTNAFQLKEVNCFNEYQIQYYESDSENLMDLYSDTFDSFTQLLQKLLSPTSPPKAAKEWTLNIVCKAFAPIHRAITGLTSDDTYSFQQENDPTEFCENQGSLTTGNTTKPLLCSSRSRNDAPEDLSANSLFKHTDDNSQETTKTNKFSELTTINHESIITSEHPYGLTFVDPLANHQRQQFESDINRGKSATKTNKKTLGGVFLRSSHQLDATTTSSTASITNSSSTYPTVHFQIPTDKRHLNWSLYAYILTEADKDSKHYIHASKGIFDNCTKNEEKFGIISGTELVNPLVVKLSQDDIRDGKYEFRMKVCNIRNLPTHKRKQLHEFPHLNGAIIHDDPALLSSKTTCDLHFDSVRYHLGCLLVCEPTAHSASNVVCKKKVDDCCISSLTVAEASRKRTNSEIRPQEDDGNQKKKIRTIDDNSS